GLPSSELANPQSGLVAGLITDATDFVRGSFLPYLRAGGKLLIEAASVVVMALYLARQPGLYRDGIVQLVAPQHRPVAARILDDAAATLPASIGRQLVAMVVLAALAAPGLWILDVPYWLAFRLLTGVAASAPFLC